MCGFFWKQISSPLPKKHKPFSVTNNSIGSQTAAAAKVGAAIVARVVCSGRSRIDDVICSWKGLKRGEKKEIEGALFPFLSFFFYGRIPLVIVDKSTLSLQLPTFLGSAYIGFGLCCYLRWTKLSKSCWFWWFSYIFSNFVESIVTYSFELFHWLTLAS